MPKYEMSEREVTEVHGHGDSVRFKAQFIKEIGTSGWEEPVVRVVNNRELAQRIFEFLNG